MSCELAMIASGPSLGPGAGGDRGVVGHGQHNDAGIFVLAVGVGGGSKAVAGQKRSSSGRGNVVMLHPY